MTHVKQTPIFPLYDTYEAKTVAFSGWEMPVRFSSIKREHEAVRNRCGLFDVSHMGEVMVTGEGALSFLQKVMTNDISRAGNGQVQYTAMCYPDGGTVDDLLVYRKSETSFMLVVNAANIDKDVEWLQKHIDREDVQVTDISDDVALLAMQGPLAETILQPLASVDLQHIRPFRFVEEMYIAGASTLISRTGYTGEDGFELYVSTEDAQKLWQVIMEAGEGVGLLPCGLGARDTLRFEVCLPLYGNELSSDISPIEAGIGFAVKVHKNDSFIGQDALREQKQAGSARKLVGIEMIDRGIPRNGYVVSVDEEAIGYVTSGTQSPTLKRNIGLALIDAQYAQVGQELLVTIRNKPLRATVVPTPFYKRST